MPGVSLVEYKRYGAKALLKQARYAAKRFVMYERARKSTEPPTRLVNAVNRSGAVATLRGWNVYEDYYILENGAYAKPADESKQRSKPELLLVEYVTLTAEDAPILPDLVHSIWSHIFNG